MAPPAWWWLRDKMQLTLWCPLRDTVLDTLLCPRTPCFVTSEADWRWHYPFIKTAMVSECGRGNYFNPLSSLLLPPPLPVSPALSTILCSTLTPILSPPAFSFARGNNVDSLEMWADLKSYPQASVCGSVSPVFPLTRVIFCSVKCVSGCFHGLIFYSVKQSLCTHKNQVHHEDPH